MRETSKSSLTRSVAGHDMYLRGKGIDIGAGDDPLIIRGSTVKAWDKQDGNAQYMKGVEDRTYDFVFSSHCLEHMVDVDEAMKNWVRILKPLGYLYVVVPDYQLYEHMRWPSVYNPDHKHSFSLTLSRDKVGRQSHHSIMEFIKWSGDFSLSIIETVLQDSRYDYNLGPVDQTLGTALAQICLVYQKR